MLKIQRSVGWSGQQLKSGLFKRSSVIQLMNFTFQQTGSEFVHFIYNQHICPNFVYILPVGVPVTTQGTTDAETNKPQNNRRAWSKEEDNRILELIEELDLKSSGKIPYRVLAKYLPHRTSKQIRERYLNNLDSNILRTPFKPEQDEAIMHFYSINGPRWKRLSRLMPGRTSTSLKNRFNTKLKMKFICGKENSGSKNNSMTHIPQTSSVTPVDLGAKIPDH